MGLNSSTSMGNDNLSQLLEQFGSGLCRGHGKQRMPAGGGGRMVISLQKEGCNVTQSAHLNFNLRA